MTRRTFLIVLCLVACASAAGAQGIAPLTPETLHQAVSLSLPLESARMFDSPLARRQLTLDSASYHVGRTERAEFVASVRALPFQFTIVTPFVNAAMTAADARRHLTDMPALDVDALNLQAVHLRVEPADNLMLADTIEDVAVKRGTRILHPTAKVVRPVKVSNLLGASRELSEGDFTFEFETFAPTESITLVFIGQRGNVEWTVLKEDLAQMR